MTTLTLVTACWGTAYSQFIPRWWQGYQSLKRKPDELILGVEKDDLSGLSESIPEGVTAKIVILPEGEFLDYWEFVMSQATSKWHIAIAIDDELCPDAFDEIDAADEAEAEIYIDTIEIRGGGVKKGHWDTSNIAVDMPVGGGPATTVELFQRIGLKKQFRWIDWVFLIDAAKAEAKPYISSTTRMIYDPGYDRATWSSVSMDATLRQAYNEEVTAYARSIGF
jgi:hypothetical protein